jgi:hypothetical protein
MRCHSAHCGMASLTQSTMRFTPPSFFSNSHDAVIRVYDDAGNVIETHEHAGDFKEW